MPFFIPATVAALGFAQAGLSILGGRAAQKAADINAQAIGEEGQEAQRRLARRTTTQIGRTQTLAAAGGAAVDSGSVQAVLEDTLEEFERERDWIQRSTEFRQRGAELEGEAAFWGGIGRSLGGFRTAASGIYTGVTGKPPVI